MLIGYDGRIKIADFGFAKSHSSPDRLTRDVNTLYVYISLPPTDI